MGKKTRLDIYEDFPTDGIDLAIERWIKDKVQRSILHYKLVDGYTYEYTAELIEKETGHYIAPKTVQRKVYEAESKLFPHLEIVYHSKQSI